MRSRRAGLLCLDCCGDVPRPELVLTRRCRATSPRGQNHPQASRSGRRRPDPAAWGRPSAPHSVRASHLLPRMCAQHVSIVISCHLTDERQPALLTETLASVAMQSRRDYEVVLLDDGSPLCVEDVVQGDGRTVIVRQENAGPALARNAGIARSRGAYLIFLDADDHLLPPAIAAGLGAFGAHPEAGFVVGPREEITFDGRPVTWTVPPPPVETRLYLSLLGFDRYIIPPSSAMFRCQVVDEIGGFRDAPVRHGTVSACFAASV